MTCLEVRVDWPILSFQQLIHLSSIASFSLSDSEVLCFSTKIAMASMSQLEASLLEENARANPDARIRPLTHASDDRAHQAESVGRNSSFSILIAILRSPNL
jgi:hypothetical protein